MEVVFAIPGDLDTPTGGYVYARRVLQLLPGYGVDIRHLALPAGFPFPSSEDLARSRQLLSVLQPQTVLLVDGLAFGAFSSDVLSVLPQKIIALVHHPLALEPGLAPEVKEMLLDSERRALRQAMHVIVPSRAMAETVAQFLSVEVSRVTVAEPGTDPADRAAGGGMTPHLLSVGSVTPRKGFDILIKALALIADKPWRATIAGSLDRDKAETAAVTALIENAGLSDRIRLTGAMAQAQIAELYAQADIFVLPSRYEGYGMVFTEAMARGLPVVGAAAGAVTHTVPPSAGILVPPDDPPALAEALASLIDKPDLRKELSDRAWAHAQTLPRWERTAAIVAQTIGQAAQ